jgi:hypothetical protein
MPRATARDASTMTTVRLFSSTKLNSPNPATPILFRSATYALRQRLTSGAGEAGDVAAEAVPDPVPGCHPRDVAAGEGAPDRAACRERSPPVRLRARRAGRIADEVRELFADDAERRSVELLPERAQLGGNRKPREVERAPRRPDEALAL